MKKKPEKSEGLLLEHFWNLKIVFNTIQQNYTIL